MLCILIDFNTFADEDEITSQPQNGINLRQERKKGKRTKRYAGRVTIPAIYIPGETGGWGFSWIVVRLKYFAIYMGKICTQGSKFIGCSVLRRCIGAFFFGGGGGEMLYRATVV